jgi:hypothetical protein
VDARLATVRRIRLRSPQASSGQAEAAAEGGLLGIRNFRDSDLFSCFVAKKSRYFAE